MSNIANFDESHAKLKGFNDFYNDKIGPYLESREAERKTKVIKGKKIGALIALVGVVIGVVSFSSGGPRSILGLFMPIVMGMGIGYAVLHNVANKDTGEITKFVLQNICTFIGWEFFREGFEEPDLENWYYNCLLSSGYDRVTFEDQMSGNVNDADFSFCECHMERKGKDRNGNTNWVTVFRGILLSVDFHREFLGRTVVLRDGKLWNAKKKSGMKRVGLVDPVFEKKFEAYSTDQVEARYLLTPVFMQTLVDLEESVSGKKIRFGFFDDKLHIAIEAPNQFEIGSMLKTLIDVERTKKILKEINAILNVIDSVSKTKKRR
ncbi:MAG: hypothetical protein COA43_10825 [Robiginitomaculum sp.]|nr:MAG: hypothetical protein COA43_10825 [Robiginitomaculum sp.]